MERDEYFKKVDAGEIESVYLFFGPEAYVRKQAERKLVDKLIEPGMDMMNLNILVAPTVDQIMESADIFPFMSEKRLVIVRELALLGKPAESGKDNEKEPAKDQPGEQSGGRGRGGIVMDDNERLIDYLKRVPETTCILFDGGDGFDKRKKLGKYLSGIPGCISFNQLEGSELQKWIRKTVKAAGAAIEPDAGERLVFLSGRDLTQLNAEIEKLSAYVGEGGTIREADVDLLATRTSEAQVFEMIDALFDGKTESAFAQTDRLLRSGEKRIGILALLARQFRQMLYVESMNQAKRPSSEISKAAGVNPYYLRKTQTRAAKMGLKTLKACFERCIQTDYDIKRGAIREEDGFARLMMEMAQIAEKRNRRTS